MRHAALQRIAELGGLRHPHRVAPHALGEPDKIDARSKRLSLTAKGRRTLEALHAFGRQQVRGALATLTEAEQRKVREGMMLYARALRASRDEMEAAV